MPLDRRQLVRSQIASKHSTTHHLGLGQVTALEDFGAFLREQHDEFGRIIREANITAE
jgi:hypothetical protein